MRKLPFLRKIVTIFFSVLFSSVLNAQVTTATIAGEVKNSKLQPVAGASVTIEFSEAGFKQTIATRSDGRFTLPNLRVGGPYKITVTNVGYEPVVTENIMLDLGLNNTIEFTMRESGKALENVTVKAAGSRLIDDRKTGASTNINNRLIRTLPTISRSADDYLRLTPSASANYNGISFAGRNGQYNNFSLDGAVFNNPFGLDAPTPGGQTNAQPISLDAIDQIQVNIAPYDVTQAGFTGAGVNTVTKSGTNKFSGTIYGFFRNQGLTGKKIDKVNQPITDLNQVQAGFALGGAIIKNKLYYFVSFETEQRRDAASSYEARNAGNAGKTSTSRVLESDMLAVRSILKTRFGYETGDYQGFSHKQTNYKWLYKIDWNINSIHKLSFTYNGLDAKKDKPAHPSAIGRRGPDYTTLQFRNSGYEIVNKLQSFSTELKSNFNGKYANKLRLVYTTFRDKRNPFSTPFPVVNISKFGSRYIVAGHEPFSIYNRLNQDAIQATNDFNVYLKNHTLTAGISYESFKFANSFNLTGYGPTLFGDIDIQTFKDSVPVGGAVVFGAYPLDVDVNYARNRAVADKWSWYYVTVAQLSGYLQDEWQATKNLKVTLGLRIDKPLYSNASIKSADFNNDGTFKGTYTEGSPTVQNNDNLILFDADGRPVTNGAGKQLDNNKLPSGKPLFSPRLGFNWNVKGDRSIQLRGGTGLFTGRFPFVWIGNHIGNPFSFFYNATDRNFKWPQVWRSNLGTDFRIKTGTVFSIDLSYTKDINAMIVRNYKLGTPTGTLNAGTGDNRKIYTAANQGTANAYVFTNDKSGYQFNASLQAIHNFKNGLYVMAGYNYLKAEDVSSISAEISSDAFDRNPILNNANKPELSPSLYGNTHRFIVALSKKFEYGKEKRYGTTISLFGNWSSGNRYAYVYGGDINNDGTGSNDLMYVPTSTEIGVMNFAPFTDVNGNVQSAATQRTALENFIRQDKYLNGRRGEFTEKYGAVSPGFSQVDLRILQDFKIKAGKSVNTFQFSIDVQNLGNMLSSKWGVRKYATNTGYYQPLSVGLAGNVPTYQFDPSQTQTFASSPELISRWQVQFGLRFIF